ncbi:hypothetical protein PQR57_44255 [Paraburkholderia dipogonis]|uniref:Uncharacterized protein n=1 Tax=Paraburkholderia dipogonis TaxID=1211383 RepID=A0ABW9B6M6_9BURK
MPILIRYNETGTAVLNLEADSLGRIPDEMRNTFAPKPFPNGDRHFIVFEHHWSKTSTRDYRRGTSSRVMSQRAIRALAALEQAASRKYAANDASAYNER